MVTDAVFLEVEILEVAFISILEITLAVFVRIMSLWL